MGCLVLRRSVCVADTTKLLPGVGRPLLRNSIALGRLSRQHDRSLMVNGLENIFWPASPFVGMHVAPQRSVQRIAKIFRAADERNLACLRLLVRDVVLPPNGVSTLAFVDIQVVDAGGLIDLMNKAQR